jgi:hypothetical protein
VAVRAGTQVRARGAGRDPARLAAAHPPCPLREGRRAADVDGLFRRCLREAWYRDERTGRLHRINRVQRGIYWLGVRWGALFSPYRREGWWRTAHVVLPLSALLAPVLVVYGLVSLLVLGGAWAAGRLLAIVWPDPIPPDVAVTCEPIVDLTPAGTFELRAAPTDRGDVRWGG